MKSTPSSFKPLVSWVSLNQGSRFRLFAQRLTLQINLLKSSFLFLGTQPLLCAPIPGGIFIAAVFPFFARLENRTRLLTRLAFGSSTVAHLSFAAISFLACIYRDFLRGTKSKIESLRVSE